MSIEPVIRSATFEDLASMIELDVAARESLATQRGGLGWLVEHAPASELNRDDLVGHSWVGTVDEHVVGFLHCVYDDVPQHGLVCSVERVFVDAL